jgi:MinD-like ATPase involved in chromosome partitioning or flagellar assembly
VVADDQVEGATARAARIGIRAVVPVSGLVDLPDAVQSAGLGPRPTSPPPGHEQPVGVDGTAPSADGRVVAVWGPAGAPGRSTVAAAVAAELARRGRRTVLVDADPYGGSIGQQLGVMDEVSGLLAAARLATAGQLEDRFATVQRGLDSRLSVVTGLPRPDRWTEVRAGTVEHVLELGRTVGDVVVDTGFSLEGDPAGELTGRGRNQLTLGALEVADEVVVVGCADPVGLSRLARGLVDLREVVGQTPVHVVVNRMRPTLGWSEKEVAGMVGGFTRLAGLHFLPDDRATVDRALVAGRTLVESGDGPITRAVAALVSGLTASA